MDRKILVESGMLIYALRYALGRTTYAPSVVIENIRHNIDKLNDFTLEIMAKEISEHGKLYSYGDRCDEDTWLEFLDYLTKSLEMRKNNC